ncbi:hypothetical protein H4S07_006133, partial [Coemansia furcata]
MSFYAKLQFENNTISIAKRPGFSMRNYASFKYSTLDLDGEDCCFIAYAYKSLYEQYATALVVYSTPYANREKLWKLKNKSKEIQSLLGYNYVIDEDSLQRLETLHTQRPITSPEPETPMYSPAMSMYQTPASVYITSPLINSGYAPWISHQQPHVNSPYNTPSQQYIDASTFAKIKSPVVQSIGEMFDSNFGNDHGASVSDSGHATNKHRLAENGALEFFFDDDLIAGKFGQLGINSRLANASQSAPAPRVVNNNQPGTVPRTVNNGQPGTAPRPENRPPPAPQNMFAPLDQENNA